MIGGERLQCSAVIGQAEAGRGGGQGGGGGRQAAGLPGHPARPRPGSHNKVVSVIFTQNIYNLHFQIFRPLMVGRNVCFVTKYLDIRVSLVPRYVDI